MFVEFERTRADINTALAGAGRSVRPESGKYVKRLAMNMEIIIPVILRPINHQAAHPECLLGAGDDRGHVARRLSHDPRPGSVPLSRVAGR